MIVMKFGGSSVESAEAIRRVTTIVRMRVDRKPVVVVSAMGKTTNALLATAKAAVERNTKYRSQLEELKAFHFQHAADLSPANEKLIGQIKDHFDELSQLLQGLAI